MARKITVVIGDFPDQPGVFHDVYLEVETIEVVAQASIRQLMATGYLSSDAEDQSYLIAGVYEGHIQSIPEVWS